MVLGGHVHAGSLGLGQPLRGLRRGWNLASKTFQRHPFLVKTLTSVSDAKCLAGCGGRAAEWEGLPECACTRSRHAASCVPCRPGHLLDARRLLAALPKRCPSSLRHS